MVVADRGGRAALPHCSRWHGLIGRQGPTLWAHMQGAYDLLHAEREVDKSDIPTLEAV
jgi:hypothetical protein